jgi:hypothetical protein
MMLECDGVVRIGMRSLILGHHLYRLAASGFNQFRIIALYMCEKPVCFCATQLCCHKRFLFNI